MTKFTTWTPADIAQASLADLLELQEYCDNLKSDFERHRAIFDMAMSAQFKPNDYGERTIERGDYKIKTKLPKNIKWAEGLGSLGLDQVRAKYDLTETAYKALSPDWRKRVDEYRTVEPGKAAYRIERIEK